VQGLAVSERSVKTPALGFKVTLKFCLERMNWFHRALEDLKNRTKDEEERRKVRNQRRIS
jgi:hypothetical protein